MSADVSKDRQARVRDCKSVAVADMVGERKGPTMTELLEGKLFGLDNGANSIGTYLHSKRGSR